jgi:hypothetical protein
VSGAGASLRTLAPFAGAIAASPVAIGVALVVLLGRRGRRHIWVFVGAWFTGIAGATVVILHLLPSLGASGPGGTPSPTLGRVIGVGLLLLAAFAAWRAHRSRGARTSLVSRLVEHLDRAPTVLVAVVAVVFAANPVHLALTTAGVDAIPGLTPAGLVALVVAVAFAAVASLPLLLVAGTVVVLPSTVDSTLVGVNTWLAARGDAVSAVVLTVAGVWILLR